MKVEIKDARVELEVEGGKSFLHINGQNVPISREVGVSLIFGSEVSKPTKLPAQPPAIAKVASKSTTSPPVKKRGCHSAASRKKLSDSMKRFHASRKRKLNGKSHMNGAGAHIN